MHVGGSAALHQRNHRKLLNAFKTTEGKFVPSVVFMERCSLIDETSLFFLQQMHSESRDIALHIDGRKFSVFIVIGRLLIKLHTF